MIVGMALKELFVGLQINGVDVQYHLGDQKELNNWIVSKSKSQKYPLIWYVINPISRSSNGGYEFNTQLILMTSTKVDSLNIERYNSSYINYLNPLYLEVCKSIKKSRFFSFNEDVDFKFLDEPFFGIEKSKLDFQSVSNQKQQSTLIDIVDAKIIYIKGTYKTNCPNG